MPGAAEHCAGANPPRWGIAMQRRVESEDEEWREGSASLHAPIIPPGGRDVLNSRLAAAASLRREIAPPGYRRQ